MRCSAGMESPGSDHHNATAPQVETQTPRRFRSNDTVSDAYNQPSQSNYGRQESWLSSVSESSIERESHGSTEKTVHKSNDTWTKKTTTTSAASKESVDASTREDDELQKLTQQLMTDIQRLESWGFRYFQGYSAVNNDTQHGHALHQQKTADTEHHMSKFFKHIRSCLSSAQSLTEHTATVLDYQDAEIASLSRSLHAKRLRSTGSMLRTVPSMSSTDTPAEISRDVKTTKECVPELNLKHVDVHSRTVPEDAAMPINERLDCLLGRVHSLLASSVALTYRQTDIIANTDSTPTDSTRDTTGKHVIIADDDTCIAGNVRSNGGVPSDTTPAAPPTGGACQAPGADSYGDKVTDDAVAALRRQTDRIKEEILALSLAASQTNQRPMSDVAEQSDEDAGDQFHRRISVEEAKIKAWSLLSTCHQSLLF